MKMLVMILMVLAFNVQGAVADDLKDVGPPETVMPSCEMAYDNLLMIDEILYFTHNLRLQLNIILKDKKVTENKALKEYAKQKTLIDRQMNEWKGRWLEWVKKWEKSACKSKILELMEHVFGTAWRRWPKLEQHQTEACKG